MAQLAAPTATTVGTVFAHSWGYDQTNVDFYEIVKVSKSGKSGKARKIKSAGVEGREDAVTAATGEDRFVEGTACSRCSNYHLDTDGKASTDAPGWDGHAYTDQYTWQARTDRLTVTHYGDHATRWDGRPMYATPWWGGR